MAALTQDRNTAERSASIRDTCSGGNWSTSRMIVRHGTPASFAARAASYFSERPYRSAGCHTTSIWSAPGASATSAIR